jgi:GTP-binding protein EngB required for normal cell division
MRETTRVPGLNRVPASDYSIESMTTDPSSQIQQGVSEGKLYENLRRLISVVDDLRDVGLQKYINLPRIVVVGTQSGGKSSVLESIVGLDFLPRGDGVVTRRPLELRLVHVAESDTTRLADAWAVFAALPDKVFTDFDEVRSEINRQTDLVAGKNKGIIDDPIVLSVYSLTCPDLTVIDLPGVTRVPLKGSDQNEDIEKITKDMAMRYITDPRTIILAVLPANQDMSTSDALQLARFADPQGTRTIGVITKIDIMDPGTDACKMLMGEEIALRLGYVGVKNRGQSDIRANVRVRSALDAEKKWFSEHPKYSKLPPGYTGTDCLVQKLTKVLFRHIKSFLPEIKKEILDRKRKVGDRLAELGEGVPFEVPQQAQLMWAMITDYCEMFKNSIRGKYDRKLSAYLSSHNKDLAVSGGSRVRNCFNEFLADFEEKRITSETTDDEIETAIRMHEGDSLPGFPSPDIFEFLILPHLRKIHSPCLDLVSTIAATLEVLSQQIARAVFRRFPKLADQVMDLTSTIFLREREATRAVIENIVSAETGYLFTNDVRYLTDHGSMQKMLASGQQQQQQPSQANSPQVPQSTTTLGPQQSMPNKPGSTPPQIPANMFEQQSSSAQAARRGRYSGPYITEIRARLDSYFELVLRNVRDSVPKAIGFFLVRQVQDKLQFELHTALNKPDALADLLGEPPHIREERKQLTSQIAILDKANIVLQRDPAIAAIDMEAALDMGDEEVKPGHVTKPPVSMGGLPGYRPSIPVQQQPQSAVHQPPRNLFDSRNKMPANPLFE